MTLQTPNNTFSLFRIGFFKRILAFFDLMEDDVGNLLEDDVGNKLISPE